MAGKPQDRIERRQDLRRQIILIQRLDRQRQGIATGQLVANADPVTLGEKTLKQIGPDITAATNQQYPLLSGQCYFLPRFAQKNRQGAIRFLADKSRKGHGLKGFRRLFVRNEMIRISAIIEAPQATSGLPLG